MKFGEEELTFLSIFDKGEKSRQNTIRNIQTQIDGLSDEAKSAVIEYELLHLMRKLKAITDDEYNRLKIADYMQS